MRQTAPILSLHASGCRSVDLTLPTVKQYRCFFGGDRSPQGAPALVDAYPLPPLFFWHRIVRRQGQYKIQTVCMKCGQEKVSSKPEEIAQWEQRHTCGQPEAATFRRVCWAPQLDVEAGLDLIPVSLRRFDSQIPSSSAVQYSGTSPSNSSCFAAQKSFIDSAGALGGDLDRQTVSGKLRRASA